MERGGTSVVGLQRAATSPRATLQPAADAEPPPPSDLSPLTPDNAVHRRVLVPVEVWPRYNCTEHNGAGWEATVVSCTRVTAVVKFAYARAADGRPYENERLPLERLLPL